VGSPLAFAVENFCCVTRGYYSDAEMFLRLNEEPTFDYSSA